MIFCPKSKTGLQIAEFDSVEILDKVVGNPNKLNLNTFVVEDKKYEVNLGSDRYHLFKKNGLVCSCCGILANKCFLDLDEQTTKESGRESYHFNFYGESQENGAVHAVLFTKDHIVSRAMGGPDDFENYQVMCWSCNTLKDTTNISNELLKKALFPAYRAYKATKSLNLAKEITLKTRRKIRSGEISIIKMKGALEKTQDKSSILSKIETTKKEIERLSKICHEFELDAQTTGICPTELEFELILQKA